MANSLIGIDPKQIDAVVGKLSKLPTAVQDAAADDVLKYMLNVERHYPPYKHITLKQAYGGWKSEKQRRFVMAAIREGRITIPYKRTQRFSKGWRIEGKGVNAILYNETEYGPFLKQVGGQSRMHILIGWQSLDRDIMDKADKISKVIDTAAKKALKKLGLV